MLILLYGPDTFRIKQKSDHIISTYQKKYAGLSLRKFDLSDSPNSIHCLSNFLNTQSLFESIKLGLITNPSFDLNFKKILKKNLDSKHLTLLIISNQKPPASFNLLLSPPTQSQFFALLDSKQLSIWVKDTAANYNLSLDKEAISSLVDITGSDLWQINSILNQLSFLNKPSPSKSDILSLTNSLKSYNDKYLIRLLNNFDIKIRLAALELLLWQNEDLAKIFNLLPYGPGISKTAASLADQDIKSGRLDWYESILSLILK